MLLHKRKRASKIGNTHTQRNDSRGGVWVKGGGPHPICGCVGVKLSPFLYHFWARKMWNKVINGDVASSFAFLLILTPWKPPNRTTSSIRILVVAGNKLNAENNTKTSSLLAALTILVTRAQFTLSVETYGKWQWMMSMELGWDVGVNVGGDGWWSPLRLQRHDNKAHNLQKQLEGRGSGIREGLYFGDKFVRWSLMMMGDIQWVVLPSPFPNSRYGPNVSFSLDFWFSSVSGVPNQKYISLSETKLQRKKDRTKKNKKKPLERSTW